MALFSRRGSRDQGCDPDDAVPTPPEPDPEPAPEAAPEPAPAPEPDAGPTPHVGISTSTFGAPPPAAPAAALSAVVDNLPLQQALAGLSEPPANLEVLHVLRQALQGPLYLRTDGDPKEQLAAGRGLGFGFTTSDDGSRFLLVFSGNAPLQASARAEGAEAVAAVGQPAHGVLRTALDGEYAGIYLDHASEGARVVLPIDLVRRAVDEAPPPPFELKTIVSGPRTDATAARAVEALTRVPVWIAVGADASGALGVAESRGDGIRRLEVFSHPLEVVARGRGDRPLPLTPELLGGALASDPTITGVVIDSAGPWLTLDRDELAPVIALAPTGPGA